MKRLFYFSFLLASYCLAQAPPTAIYPNAVATDHQLVVAKNQPPSQTVLSASIEASDTTIPLFQTTNLVANMLLTIQGEVVFVCSVTSNSVIVGKSTCPNVDGRGFDGTTAQPHSPGVFASAYVTAWHHNSLRSEIEAIEATLGPNLSRVPGGTTPGSCSTGLTVIATVPGFPGVTCALVGLTNGITGVLPHGNAPVDAVYTDINAVLTSSYDFHLGRMRFPESSVAALPSASGFTGSVYVVTDGTTASDCTIGGASTPALCRSNGSAWLPLGGSAGGAGTVTHTAGALVSTNCVTGNGGADIQTPSSLCNVDSNGNQNVASETVGAGSGKTGDMLISGATSGAQGFTVSDVAGSAVLYLLPAATSVGNFLKDNGLTTCPTLAAGVSAACEQLAWAAAGGGSGGLTVNTTGVGYKMIPFDVSSIAATDIYGTGQVAGGTSNPFCMQFQLDYTLLVTTMSVRISSLTGTGGWAFALFADGVCGTLVSGGRATTQNITTGTTGQLTFTWASPPTLSPGVYSLMFASEGTTVSVYEPNTLGVLSLYINETSHPRHSKCSNGTSGSGASLALPSTCGTLTAVGVDGIFGVLRP